MTTASQLRAMMREEAAEPLDYPRLGGVSEEWLTQYNLGYRVICHILTSIEGLDDASWWEMTVEALADEEISPTRDPYIMGYDAAVLWIRTELDGIEVPK